VSHPSRPRRPPVFQPRFTVGLLYLCLFFFLYALLIVAPPLWDMWQSLPPGAEEDEQVLAQASELARGVVQPRLWIALAAALLTTGLGSYAGLLPGTGRR
jgi:hypothetical protein